MGSVDIITKDYMKDNSVFADAFNYFLYDGKQVIRPESLQELDTTEIAIPFANGNEEAVQKFRDLLKSAILMSDDKAAGEATGCRTKIIPTDGDLLRAVKEILEDI